MLPFAVAAAQVVANEYRFAVAHWAQALGADAGAARNLGLLHLELVAALAQPLTDADAAGDALFRMSRRVVAS
jgi:hypothetical protein